jgi:metal-responsive CopG/Arc/MetJ family transcriptional regulator
MAGHRYRLSGCPTVVLVIDMSKVAINIEKATPEQFDELVKSNAFPNRSKAVQVAVTEKLSRSAGPHS